MDSDAVGALFVTTSGSVVQPYDALVALRIAGAVIAVISLIAAILSLHHSCGCPRVPAITVWLTRFISGW